MASHHQPETAPQLPLPGDIVQVTDRGDRWYLALLIVEGVRAWGLQAYALVPVPGEDGFKLAYYRIAHGKYELVGTARLVEAHIAKARDHAIETAKLLAKDKGTHDEPSAG